MKHIQFVDPVMESILESTVEGTGETRVRKFRGLYQKADAVNKNNRVYPRSLWETVLKDTDFVDRLKNRQVLGMLGHPKDGQLDLEKASHVTTSVELKSNNEVFGESELLPTDKNTSARILDGLFEAKIRLGVSSRGRGDSSTRGSLEYLKDNFYCAGWDVVPDPSVVGTWQHVESISGGLLTQLDDFIAILQSQVQESMRPDEIRLFRWIAESLKHPALTDRLLILRDKIDSAKVIVDESKADPDPRATNSDPVVIINKHEESSMEKLEQLLTENGQLKSEKATAETKATDLAGKLESVITKLEEANEMIRTLNEQCEEAEANFEAAKQLAQAYKDKSESLATSTVSTEKYESLRDELASTRKKLVAAEKLVAKLVDDNATESVQSAIDKLVTGTKNETELRSILSKCESAEEVNEMFSTLGKIIPANSQSKISNGAWGNRNGGANPDATKKNENNDATTDTRLESALQRTKFLVGRNPESNRRKTEQATA